MASILFNSALDDALSGNIDFADDTFRVLLVTSAYSPNKDTHTKRSDVRSEVANGSGYMTGGAPATVTVTKDTISDRIEVSLGEAVWPNSTIIAAAAVYYKARGGLVSADELVAYIDFGGNVGSMNGRFTLSPSTIRLQN